MEVRGYGDGEYEGDTDVTERKRALQVIQTFNIISAALHCSELEKLPLQKIFVFVNDMGLKIFSTFLHSNEMKLIKSVLKFHALIVSILYKTFWTEKEGRKMVNIGGLIMLRLNGWLTLSLHFLLVLKVLTLCVG